MQSRELPPRRPTWGSVYSTQARCDQAFSSPEKAARRLKCSRKKSPELGCPVWKDLSAEIMNQLIKSWDIRNRRPFGAARTHLAKQMVSLRRGFEAENKLNVGLRYTESIRVLEKLWRESWEPRLWARHQAALFCAFRRQSSVTQPWAEGRRVACLASQATVALPPTSSPWVWCKRGVPSVRTSPVSEEGRA